MNSEDDMTALLVTLSILVQDDYSIIAPGQYHGDEVVIQEEEGWLALAVMDGEWELLPLKLSLERVQDPYLDSEGDTTGWRVAGDAGDAMFCLWAGDLDGDGLADIVLNDCAHYAIYANLRLFPSGQAEEGELLKEVCCFKAVSC